MALFGSDKKTTKLLRVRPTVVRTQNVAKEIFKVAKSYEVKPETLDFNLLGVQSYTRIKEDDNETEWEEIPNEALNDFDTETQLLNPHFQIKQVYEIEIFSKVNDLSDNCSKMKTAVGANATKCKVYLSISAGSSVKYFPQFEHEFSTMILKKKIRAGILIYIFDTMVERFVNILTAKIRVEEKVDFIQSETHLIAEGYEPTATRDDALILHYEKNEEIDENTKIDYAARGFIQSVKEGDLLIEYVKAKPGKPGRNCRGEFMKPSEPVVKHEPTFKVDDTIVVKEDDDSIKYFAKENGYIAFQENTYTIKTDVDVGEISFKTTGSIASGVDSEVNISVREADAVKDAVGTGMTVEVTEIEIEGNVGSNAKVIAKKASVGGQTHKSAMIRANELKINVHKGKAYGKHISVERLEHGEIEGDEVKITQAVGGSIRAKEIYISQCASHVQATASRLIEIKKLIGSENVFTIDPLLKKDDLLGMKEHEKKIKTLEQKIKETKSQLKKYKILIKEGTPAFIEIKKRLLHYKKNGVKMPQSFVKKYKDFQAMQEMYKELQNSYETLQDQLNLLTTRTASFQDNIFDARIINHDSWKGYNEIKFKLVDPPMELVYKPIEGSEEHIFALKQISEDEYAIRPVSE
jgi:hypothetical protein